MKNVLITGGSGFIGKSLSTRLHKNGYSIIVLGRKASCNQYCWDIDTGTADKEAFSKADYVVHLAGAGIAEKRWSLKRKEELVYSRVASTGLLFKCLKTYSHNVKAVVAVSAIGYYGNGDTVPFVEADPPGYDFLGQMCLKWEKAIKQISSLDIRIAINRLGVVLSNSGGALPQMVLPLKYSVSLLPGNGNQYLPWIHIDDLCNFIQFEIENEGVEGIYNVVAPEHKTNRDIMICLGKIWKKKILFFPVSLFILKLTLGEFANFLFFSVKVSANKMMSTGFKFQYPVLLPALQNIFDKNY